MIYGAGEAGRMVLEEIIRHPDENIDVVGFFDDDMNKHGKIINGKRVFGGRSRLKSVLKKKKVEEIIIAMPSISKDNIKEIVAICKSEKVSLLIVPSTMEIIKGDVKFDQIKRLDLSDLLDRKEADLDKKEVSEYIAGKGILVSGAAGSIGSVLVEKLFEIDPSFVVGIDINESGLFHLSQRLMNKGKFINVVGDIKDRDYLDYVFDKYNPDIVFHAAAYKHVPLMEQNLYMAVLNNLMGTINLLESSLYIGIDRFINISTDKAVYPFSVMGKTKRITELLIKAFSKAGMRACSVRFGNVLGSNGSVVKVFEEQIRRGGPVTVTDPKMERFFMTINEAVNLVIKAGKIGNDGDVYILDMGKPIKIRELAENLIILSGFLPYKDIQIVYTGVRDGERITERLFHDEFVVEQSRYDGIMIEKNDPVDYGIIENIKTLVKNLFDYEEKDVKNILDNVIKEYSGLISKNKMVV